MIGELVKVIWNDAHGSAANVCYDIDEIPHMPVEVTSYGILLKMDEVGVSIASEKCDDSTWRGYSFVPAGMLVKVVPMNKQKKPRKSKVSASLETTEVPLEPSKQS
jgi:hypothetical protein